MTFFARVLTVASLFALGCGASGRGPSKAAASVASPRAPADEVAFVARPSPARVREHGLSLPRERGVRVAWSRDGRVLAATGLDPAGRGADRFTVRLWDLSRGALVGLLAAHRAPISALAFTPGDELITASLDGTMRIWDTRSGGLLGTLDHARARRERPGANAGAGWGVLPVVSMDLSADGNTIASTSGARDVVLWSVAGSELLAVLEGRQSVGAQRVGTRETLRGGHVEAVTCVAFSADSRTLATASRLDGTVRLWDVRTGAAKRVLAITAGAAAPDGGPTSLAWSGGDGSTLAVGTARGTVELWDTSSGTRTAIVASGADRPVALPSIAFRPHGTILAAAATEGSARLLRLRHTPALLTELRLGTDERTAVDQVAWSRDGSVLAVAGDGLLLARARDGATIALHAFVDEDGRPRWLAEADDGHVDGDALPEVELRPGLLRAFFAGR